VLQFGSTVSTLSVQIFYDYNFDSFAASADSELRTRCRCGAINCMGFLGRKAGEKSAKEIASDLAAKAAAEAAAAERKNRKKIGTLLPVIKKKRSKGSQIRDTVRDRIEQKLATIAVNRQRKDQAKADERRDRAAKRRAEIAKRVNGDVTPPPGREEELDELASWAANEDEEVEDEEEIDELASMDVDDEVVEDQAPVADAAMDELAAVADEELDELESVYDTAEISTTVAVTTEQTRSPDPPALTTDETASYEGNSTPSTSMPPHSRSQGSPSPSNPSSSAKRKSGWGMWLKKEASQKLRTIEEWHELRIKRRRGVGWMNAMIEEYGISDAPLPPPGTDVYANGDKPAGSAGSFANTLAALGKGPEAQPERPLGGPGASKKRRLSEQASKMELDDEQLSLVLDKTKEKRKKRKSEPAAGGEVVTKKAQRGRNSEPAPVGDVGQQRSVHPEEAVRVLKAISTTS
jgi:hypothetical protein